MIFDIITIFPKVFESYFNTSILKKAQSRKLISIRVHDLRDFAKDKRRTVDDRAYGGGPGMVIKAEPIIKAVQSIKPKNKAKIVFFAASGKQFDNKTAAGLAKKNRQLILICGHYEGIDERAKKALRDSGLEFQELSIGPYVLTGGELGAMVLIDAVSRRIPGVLGKEESLEEKRLGIGVPVYTRPETFAWKGRKYGVPKVLLSGDHKKIEKWRRSKRR